MPTTSTFPWSVTTDMMDADRNTRDCRKSYCNSHDLAPSFTHSPVELDNIAPQTSRHLEQNCVDSTAENEGFRSDHFMELMGEKRKKDKV